MVKYNHSWYRLCINLSIVNPAIVANKVDINVDITVAVGLILLYKILKAIIVVGTIRMFYILGRMCK